MTFQGEIVNVIIIYEDYGGGLRVGGSGGGWWGIGGGESLHLDFFKRDELYP